jgi:hypothetical protein
MSTMNTNMASEHSNKARTAYITSMLTEEERAAIERIAIEENKSVSAVVRELLLGNPAFAARLFFLSTQATSDATSKSEDYNLGGSPPEAA